MHLIKTMYDFTLIREMGRITVTGTTGELWDCCLLEKLKRVCTIPILSRFRN